MSTINFRLYADQIYGLACSKLKDYVTPEIEKEEFTKMFNDGQVKYDNIQSKQKIIVHPQMTINNLQIENTLLNIPNETENFSMNLSGVKTELELFNIKENEVENLIIQKRKDLVEKFISYAVKKIENKEESKSFLEGLIENLVNRALNGLKIEINNIELRIKYKKHIFILIIEHISYSEENGVQIKNTSILYEEDNLNNKNYIIKQFSIDAEIKKAEDESGFNQLNIKMSDFQFELTKNIFLAFNEIFNLGEETKYKYIYVRYKKLIQYYKPKKPDFSQIKESEEKKEKDENNNNINEEKNKYYNSLWLYAIKTVIKLQKYVGYDKLYLLDLLESTQNKISKKYVDDNNNTEKLILPTEINLLKATKEQVEKKVLDGKKGNALTNAFFSFFGGGNKDEEEKKELSEDERKTFENIYTDEYLIKYLYGKNKDEKEQSNPIKDKIISFISKLKINVIFNKLELILANDDVNKCTLFISNIKVLIEKENNDINSVATIGNIGSNLDESLFSERVNINENNDLIMISKDKDNKIKVDLGFKNIDLSEDLFNFILIFFSSLKTEQKNRIFKNINYEIKNEEEKKNEEKKEEKEEEEKKEDENKGEEGKVEEEKKVENENKSSKNEIFKNFSISNIPSLVISSNGNKTFFTIKNYSITPSKIEITYNIKDSFGTILDDYTFEFNKDEKNNKYSLNLKTPLNIILKNESSKILFIFILKLKERINQIKIRNQKINTKENNNSESEEEKELYGFNYVIHKNLDIKDFNINELKIEILIEKINIEIYENKVKTQLIIQKLNLKYENKELLLKIDKISVDNNLMSTMILYLMNFKSPNFNEFQPYIESIKKEYKDNNNTNDNKDEIVNKNEENKDGVNIKYEFNIDNFLNSFKIYINLIIFNFQTDDNIISFGLNKISIEKKEQIILIKLSSINISFKKDENNAKIFKIFNLEKETQIESDPKKNLISILLNSPAVNIDLITLKIILEIYQYLSAQMDMDMEEVGSKSDIKVYNSSIILNNEFNISISEIFLKNYDDKNNDTTCFTINDFVINNKKNEYILGQKNININIVTKSIIELSFILKFSDLIINLSKSDIDNLSKILLVFDDKKDNNDSKIIKNEPEKQQKESHEYKISLELNMPLIDFALCSEDRNKKCELILSSLESNLKIFIPSVKGKTNNTNDIQKNINLFLGKINLVYNNDNNEIYNIIEFKGKEENGYDLEDKNLINFEQNENIKNQIEFNLTNEKNKDINDVEMNVNKFELNIKLDILINLLLYIKQILPKNILKNKKIGNNENLENKKNQCEINVNLNFNQIQFKFESINNIGEKCIYIYINRINYNYNSKEGPILPLGYNEIKLDKLLILLINNEEINKILTTQPNFIAIKADMKEKSISSNINIDEMMISISYTDIILIKEIISSNTSVYNKNKSELIQSKEEDNERINIPSDKLFSLNYNMKQLDFTLIDNYSNNNYPFLNLKLKDLCSIVSEKKSVNSSLYITLSTYNYISSVWEPIIENSCISSMLIQKKENNSIVNSIKIEIYKLLLNISDMFISSIVLSLNNLTKILDKNNNLNQTNIQDINKNIISNSMNSVFSNSIIQEINLLPQKKVSNNKIINCTGKELKIKFNNNIINCKPSSEAELEYVNRWDKFKSDNKKLKVIYDNNNIIDINFGKLGIDFYKLNNNQFLVWENIVSKERQINIIFYSQFILKNKTNYTFQIKLMNNKLGNLFILLKSNSISGIPLSYCNKNTSFTLKIVKKEINNKEKFNENNNKINLSNIIGLSPDDNYEKKINLQNVSLLLKLQKKIKNVNTLLITSEYSFVNCLPCDIQLETNNGSDKIKKCSQYQVDFCSDSDLDIKLKIKIGQEYFESNNIKLSILINEYEENESKNTILFKNQRGQYFNLSFFLKNKEYHKSIVIYSEYILYNDSGINFRINSEFLFNIDNNLYLISNKINLEESNFQISDNIFNSYDINLQEVVKASPYYPLALSNGTYNLNLPIKKNMSFISIRNNPNFRENIVSMVFYILPICKITNLISNKQLILKDVKDDNNNYIIAPPLNQVSFNFFNKGKENTTIELGIININENKINTNYLFNLFQCGIYTFFYENEFFNLEIKDSSSDGILNIFVTEATIQNAKIIANNKTKIDFEIYQLNYDNNKQIIKGNESQIIKIYDQNYTGFIAIVCGKKFEMNFISFKEELDSYAIDNKYVLVKESNGVKMKITLYNKSEFEKLNKDEKNLYVHLVINNCYISLIGDNFNKNRKLRNYERNEILLFYFQNLNTEIIVNKNKEIIHKNNINLYLNLSKLEIFNQLSKKGKYSCIFKNMKSPFIKFVGEFDLYNKDQVAKINKFSYNMNKLKLNIEPQFILQIINFADNIAYRLGKINFNVDKVFLRTNKNYRDITIQKNIEKYKNNQKLLCFGEKFSFPSINIDFELTEINLEELLREKVGCTDLLVWIGFGLIKKNQNIYLEKFTINNYFGDFEGLLLKMQNNYKSQMSSVILNIGIRGILGQIRQIFFKENRTDENSTEVQKNRIRYPRAFYGKYYYIKNYNEEEAKIIDKINLMFKKDFNEIFCNDILQSKNYIFYFSGSSLFIFTRNYELYYKIDYENVDKVDNEEENLVIKYKKDNDEENPPSVINCDEIYIAKRMIKLLNNYVDKL